jgi:hypothetical protein
MEQDRMPKKIFTREPEGTRRRGRPRKRWEEEVERDLQVLGVRRWTDLVTDGENIRTLFDRPKPTVGCSVTGRRKKVKIAVACKELVFEVLIFVDGITLMSVNNLNVCRPVVCCY